MSGSQQSYEARLQRFVNGNSLIQIWADYDAPNPLITKAALNQFVLDANARNTAVITTLNTLGTKRNERRLLCFIIKDTNPDCAERRIEGIIGYLSSGLGVEHKTVQLLKAIIRKIKPRSEGAVSAKSFVLEAGEAITINKVVNGALAKNTGTTDLDWSEPGGPNPPETVNPGEETTITAPSGIILVKNLSNKKRGKISVEVRTGKEETNSKMEKSFASIVGHLNEVVDLIIQPMGGLVYNPPDSKLTIQSMIDLRDQLVAKNAEVSAALNANGEAVRARVKIYNGIDGLNERIRIIKGYLIGFPGRKEADHYIEYVDAIEGV